jgi:hypothetical protein
MYEIRIAGQLDDTTLAVFAGLEVTHHDQVTVITGEFDQAALHGMLELIRSLASTLVEARRVPAGSRKEVLMTRHSYEIKIIGSLGPATREAFADLVVEVEPTITVLSGDLDQSSLHDVLDRVRALGLELVEIKQASSSA